MGQKSSNARGGGYQASSVPTHNGEIAYLGRKKLVYGEKDPYLNAQQRTDIESFEERRINEDVEYGRLLDANGNPVIPGGERAGTPKDTYFYESELNNSVIGSHTHVKSLPDQGGLMGGTFSEEDLVDIFNDTKSMVTYRAKTTEGTYSISKTKSYDSVGARDYFKKVSQKRDAEMNAKLDTLNAKYEAGKISHNKYVSKWNAIVNKSYVDVHNDLLAGQKKYGYFYTLERTGTK